MVALAGHDYAMLRSSGCKCLDTPYWGSNVGWV